MRTIFVHLLLVATLGFFSFRASAAPKQWPCGWVHGRMIAGNGTPSIRIWPSGTHRLFGVVNAQHPIADDAYEPDVPGIATALLTPENDYTAWGNFYVCPVAPERAGWMRFVVVPEARGLHGGR